jgi:hypothetical protein
MFQHNQIRLSMISTSTLLVLFYSIISVILADSPASNSSSPTIPLCYSSYSTTGLALNTTYCVPLQSAVLNSECGQFLNSLVADDLNQTFALQQALFHAFDGKDRNKNCPFFTRLSYQCIKYFPPCQYNSASLAQNSPLCRSVCSQAYSDDNSYCAHAFSAQYMAQECENSCFFAQSNCLTVDLSTVSAVDKQNWRIITGCLLGALGLILLCSICVKNFARISPNREREAINQIIANRNLNYNYDKQNSVKNSGILGQKDGGGEFNFKRNSGTSAMINRNPSPRNAQIEFARKNSIEITQLPSSRV